jgi:hypothetical protein
MSDRNSRPIEEEVRKLFKTNNGKISNNDFIKLRNKYQDVDLVEKIQQLYLEKYERITRKAKKFALLIKEKYNNDQYPFHTLLEKARLYKQKHNLSDEEFQEFQRIYEQELIDKKSTEVIIPFNNMSKLLGNMNVEIHAHSKISDNDLKVLQEIIKLHASSKTLHAQVQLQTFQYTDCAPEVIESKFHREMGISPSDHVHPVLAALFIPKFEKLDKLILHANLSAIIKVRFNNAPFITRSDYELFWSLTNDPNDVICDATSPMMDLLNRAHLQNSIWNSVLNLRSGNIFNTSFRQFLTTVDMCKRTQYDNPELLYGRSDIIILKRILSSFSFRPILIATTPFFLGDSVNPYNQNMRPVITRISMYNFKLPFNYINNEESNFNLNSVFTQKQIFIENNKFISKETHFISAEGIVIITVDRTAYNIYPLKQNEERMLPFKLSTLPTSVGGKYNMDSRPVSFEQTFTVGGAESKTNLVLRSVIVTKYNSEFKIVTGSATIIISDPLNKPLYHYYDPNKINYKLQSGKLLENPIREIDYTHDTEENFMNLATTSGTVFIYECQDA